MTHQDAGPAKSLVVGRVIRSVEDSETIYQIRSHPSKGFNALVVSGSLVLIGSLALDCFVLIQVARTWGNDRYADFGSALLIALLALLFVGATVSAVDSIWWRRVCLDGTEVVILRDKFLIHRGKAFGRTREWTRPLDKVRTVRWIPARGNRYVSTVTLWSRFPNMFVVGWALDPESSEFLASELRAAAVRLQDSPRPP